MEEQNLKSYKPLMIIPDDVERKIRQWCILNPATEWSGTLFYDTEGTLEEENFKAIAKDFYVSDVGSSGYTEYEMNPEVITYMAEKDLLDCKIALIHSHNNFAAFFSGTDVNTLKQKGAETVHFLSLVVNNAGQYVCRITRQVEEVVYNSKRARKYKTFNSKVINLSEETIEPKTVVTVDWLDMEVQHNTISAIDVEIQKRYDELVAAKSRNSGTAFPSVSNGKSYGNYGKSYEGYGGYAGYYGESWGDEDDYPSLFHKESYPSYSQAKREEHFFPSSVQQKPKEKQEEKQKETQTSEKLKSETKESPEELYGIVPENVVKDIAAQILLGSITSNFEAFNKINVKTWVSKYMKDKLDKRFTSIQEYGIYISGIIDFIMWNTEPYDVEDMANALLIYITTLEEELEKENPYLSAIINNISNYL